MKVNTDPAKEVVEQFSQDTGGDFLTGEDTSDVDIDWEFHIGGESMRMTLCRFVQEYESHTGKTVEMPPVLTARFVNYGDEDLVNPMMMLVIEDDPNGFQKDVADLSVEYREDDEELTFLLDEMDFPDVPPQRVTIRYVGDGQFRVLEDVTEMG